MVKGIKQTQLAHRPRTFRNGGQQDTTYTYNGAGLLEKITTPDGVTENYVYDAARRLKEITRNEPDGLAKKVLTYNANSQVTREDIFRGNLLRFRTYTDYDELGRVRKRRGNHGQDVTFTYDTNNNLQTITDSLGKVTSFTYDALNRPETQTDARNGTTMYAYAHANPVNLTDPLGLTVMVCRDPAFNGNFGPAKHYWLVTDTQSSGMGRPAAGANAGNQYDPLGARVQTVSHKARKDNGDRECREAKGADEPMVNKLIAPGKDLGIFFPGFNDCQGFVRDVLRQSGGEFPFWPESIPTPNPYLPDPYK